MDQGLQAYFGCLSEILFRSQEIGVVGQILDHALGVLNRGSLFLGEQLQQEIGLSALAEPLYGTIGRISLQERYRAVLKPPRGTWGDALLSLCCCSWWETLDKEAQENLIAPFFFSAPVSTSLACLEGYLSTLPPSRSLQVAPVGAQMAHMLLDRILEELESGNSGQLVEEVLNGADGEGVEEDLIRVLARLPDLMGLSSGAGTSFRRLEMAARIVRVSILAFGQDRDVASHQGKEDHLSARVVQVGFLVKLLEKLIRRGYVVPAARALVQELYRDEVGWKREFIRCAFSKIEPREKLLITMVKNLCEKKVAQDREALFLLSSLIGPATIDKMNTESDSPLSAWDKDLIKKCLMKSTLPYPALSWFVQALSQCSVKSMNDCCTDLCQMWADNDLILTLDSSRQAYLTAAIVLILNAVLDKQDTVDNTVMRIVVEGVSNRLSNPSSVINYQGMRVAEVLGKVQKSGAALFKDIQIDFKTLREEEMWEGALLRPALETDVEGTELVDIGSSEPPLPVEVSEQQQESIDSDDDTNYSISDSDLEPLDLTEDIDSLPMTGERPTTLEDILSGLRNARDPKSVVQAVKLLPTLLNTKPDETDSLAVDLAKALVYAPIPDWSDDDPDGKDEIKQGCKDTLGLARIPIEINGLERFRFASMVSLLVASPQRGGQALIAEVYSTSQTIVGRLTIMEALCEAAEVLSNGGTWITSPAALASGSRAPEICTRSSSTRDEKTRVWGVRSLEIRCHGNQRVFRNLFLDVAVAWTTSLLQECDIIKHCVDLFGKQHMVLGKLLVTLGTFVHSVSQTSTSEQLALAILELIASPSIHQHQQPHVRRSALIAAFQIVSGLSPSIVASASLGKSSGSPTDIVLANRLGWLENFAVATAKSDTDGTCRQLAEGCIEKQKEVASKAMEFLQNTEIRTDYLSNLKVRL